MALIPTSFRAKIPRGLSYPVGSEVVSRALADVPQYSRLTLTFWAKPFSSSSQFRAELVAGKPMDVFVASYRHVPPGLSGSRGMIESGWYDEQWGLTVYPVASERRQDARRLLLEGGLVSVRRWLSELRDSTWYYGHKRMAIRYDPTSNSIGIDGSEG
jgi:hypothetical protein